jgi:hypothetical protein
MKKLLEAIIDAYRHEAYTYKPLSDASRQVRLLRLQPRQEDYMVRCSV